MATLSKHRTQSGAPRKSLRMLRVVGAKRARLAVLRVPRGPLGRRWSSERAAGPSYERLTPTEHVLKRPGMYIGSTSAQPEPLWLNPALALAVLCTFRQELVVPSVVMFACSPVKASAQMDSLWSLHQTKSPN